MKGILTSISLLATLLLFNTHAQAQDTARVSGNKEKIKELNNRLDNLLKGNEGKKDSLSIKVDEVLVIVKELQIEMNKLKGEVEELKSAKLRYDIEPKEATTSLSSGAYYVVVAARGNKERIQKALIKMQKEAPLMIVQNSRGTWFHLIHKKAYSMSEARQMAEKEKQNGIADAWWVTGRKLSLD
jgi:hypothetical protein